MNKHASKTAATVREYPIYAKGSDELRGWVDTATAREWIENGAARFFRGPCGASLRLTGAAKELRGTSCRMGPAVVEANADAQVWAVAMTDEWKWRPAIRRMEAPASG